MTVFTGPTRPGLTTPLGAADLAPVSRFAGTWNWYSKNATPHAMIATRYQGLDAKSRRWPHHVYGMNKFETINSRAA